MKEGLGERETGRWKERADRVSLKWRCIIYPSSGQVYYPFKWMVREKENRGMMMEIQ